MKLFLELSREELKNMIFACKCDVVKDYVIIAYSKQKYNLKTKRFRKGICVGVAKYEKKNNKHYYGSINKNMDMVRLKSEEISDIIKTHSFVCSYIVINNKNMNKTKKITTFSMVAACEVPIQKQLDPNIIKMVDDNFENLLLR
jgi:hypothetical protein